MPLGLVSQLVDRGWIQRRSLDLRDLSEAPSVLPGRP